jgi:trehalose-6-phosphate synthase
MQLIIAAENFFNKYHLHHAAVADIAAARPLDKQQQQQRRRRRQQQQHCATDSCLCATTAALPVGYIAISSSNNRALVLLPVVLATVWYR